MMYGIERAPFLGHGLGFLGGLFGLLLWVAFIALVVVAVVKMTRHGRMAHAAQSFSAPHQAPGPQVIAEDQALRIARERLARGEIDPEQYRAIVEALSI